MFASQKSNVMIRFIFYCLLVAFLCSCGGGKPPDSEIKKKILMSYVCNETATVNNLTIHETKDAESIGGNKGYEYVVSGEIEWKEGCREFGMNAEPGRTERFENKRVFLIKGDDGKWH